MKKLISFLSYHNAIPVAAVIIALGAGGALAATSADLPPFSSGESAAAADALAATSTSEADVSAAASSTAAAPDASYLLDTDLATYMPAATVTGVTEDADNYYVAYTLSTIAQVGDAWQEADEPETLTVPKAVLGAQDLGLYAADQLAQKSAQELAYLKRVQQAERDKDSGAQAAAAYAALVGKTVNADSSGVAGYTPVVETQPVVEPAAAPSVPQQSAQPEQQDAPAAAATSTSDAPDANGPADTGTASTTPASDAASDADATSTAPVDHSETDATSTPDISNDATSTPASDNAAADAPTATSTAPTDQAGADATSTAAASE